MSGREIQQQGRLCAMQQPEHHSCTYTDLNPWMPYIVKLEFNKGSA